MGFCGGPFTVAGYVIEGKPTRDFVRGEDADVPRAVGLACADGEADRDLRAVPAGEGRRRGGRDPGLRLVGGRAFACRLRGVRRSVLGADPGRRRRADDPLRDRDGHAASGDGRGRRRRDRARLADPPGRGLGSRRRGSRRAGQPRPCRSARARGSGSRPAPPTFSREPPAGRGMSSTSVMGCCPTRIRRCCAGWSSWSTNALPSRCRSEDARDRPAAPRAR